MTVLLRSLVVWLLLLAVPYQGYASATMMLCAASAQATATAAPHTMSMPAGAHDHAAMMAAQAHDGHAHGGDAKSAHTHNTVKCGGSACCAAGAPVLAHEVVVPMLPVQTDCGTAMAAPGVPVAGSIAATNRPVCGQSHCHHAAYVSAPADAIDGFIA